ncbi:MAG: hypothetical protein GAK30_03530 [Paracidovorax wautersii]|uniref:Tripartite-type tricarboxylate transporter, receptor component TctC n=1 Tax=Paracidovorax wautersii TaxID=1177982 RepID=A0A7V8FL33_9BURK|nr:MAG: hypothetical protein GAK30_03530 [Paracidovorax wautersii]
MLNRRECLFALASLPLAGFAGPSRAQNWPDKPIRFILSQPAGSGPDAMARLVGHDLTALLGQAVIVENRPGGQNAIGAQAAARSAADGSTFYVATAAALVTNPFLFKSLSYDPRSDFTPVGMVGVVPFAISVNANAPFRSFTELVTYAKANPGKLDIANEGPRTFGGLLTRFLAAQLGLDIHPVSYSSVSAAVNDTVAGQIGVLVSDVPSVLPMVKAGRLRTLAVTTTDRVPGLDNVPTVADTLPGFDFYGWVGIVAPAGTSAPVVQAMNRALDRVLANLDLAERIRTIGPITHGAGTPAQMQAMLDKEHARWAKLTKDFDIQPE